MGKASPQSFAINKVPVNGRKITVLEVHPSDNNWQYHLNVAMIVYGVIRCRRYRSTDSYP